MHAIAKTFSGATAAQTALRQRGRSRRGARDSADEADQALAYLPETEAKYTAALDAAVAYEGDDMAELKRLFDRADRAQGYLLNVTTRVARLNSRAAKLTEQAGEANVPEGTTTYDLREQS